MTQKQINDIRHVSRKLVRELGILEIDKDDNHANPQNWHALIEISNNPGITVSKLSQNLVLHISSTSRLVDFLLYSGFIAEDFAHDRRSKSLKITKRGKDEIKRIDDFSISRISNAFRFLGAKDRQEIINSIQKYTDALEKSRTENELGKIKIRTISTSRVLRKQIKKMIENIQKNEFKIDIDEFTNYCVIDAERDFYYNNCSNFFYATNEEGNLIGSIGLKKIDKKSAEIKKFFVIKEYRGQKVGKALMTKLLTAAQKHEFQDLYLGTVEVLRFAHKFYLEHGFQEIPAKKLPKNYQKSELDNLFFKGKTYDVIRKIA